MKAKCLCFLSICILTSSPLMAVADGCFITTVSTAIGGDWTRVDENAQQAFINYRNGLEKMIVAVDIQRADSDAVWIMPIPGDPKDVRIDITIDLPMLFGDDVISRAKLAVARSIKVSCAIGAVSHVWVGAPLMAIASIAPSFMRSSMRAGGGSVMGPAVSGDLVSVETHIEKRGMVAEVISARTSEALYNYLSSKGLDVVQRSIPVLDSYIGRKYVFVVSWLSSGPDKGEDRENRGIFVAFPTARIYYPLVPTSLYGERKIPITIRVLGHVEPRIYREIEAHTVTQYLIKEAPARKFDKSEGDPSPALQEFYGDRRLWSGNCDYTKIRISAPARLLEEDLWMDAKRPLQVSLALPSARHPEVFALFLYLLLTAILSLLAGGIAGLICFRKFRRYALIGLANVGTVIGFLIAFFVKMEEHQKTKWSRRRTYFILLAHCTFVFVAFIGLVFLSGFLAVAFAVSLVLFFAVISLDDILRSASGRFMFLFSALFLCFTVLFWVSSTKVTSIRRVRVSTNVTSNLAQIRTALESYYAETGIYLACPPNPAAWRPGVDAAFPWDVGVQQWEEAIGFRPELDGYVRYQYEVTVSDDGQSFIVTATGDLDEDGKEEVFTVDSRAAEYPKAVKSGDDRYRRSSSGFIWKWSRR